MKSFLKLLAAIMLALILTGCAALIPDQPEPETDESAGQIQDANPERMTGEPEDVSAEPEDTTAQQDEGAAPVTEAPPAEPAGSVSDGIPAQDNRAVFSYHGLVDLLALDDSFFLDQRYATADNFTGVVHYDRELCLVSMDITDMLIEANDMAKEHGCRIKIWDAYRPISVQQALSDSAPEELKAYVPAPSPYAMHARGITVDVTLCNEDGENLDMPTDFDDFSEAAHSDYAGATQEQTANRELLIAIMQEAGFKVSALEWWHFDGPNRDNYEILDVSFEEFEKARAADG